MLELLIYSVSCASSYLSTRPFSTHVVVKCNCTKQVFIFFYICIAVWDPITKRVGLGPISQFNPATCLCLFQARTLISNVICCGKFLCSMISIERWLFVLFKLSFHNWYNLIKKFHWPTEGRWFFLITNFPLPNKNYQI